MLNSELSKKLSTIALLFCAVIACKSLGTPKVLKSKDGKFQFTVPAEWIEAPGLNDQADIAAKNAPKELYAFVLTESKSDFPKDMTLDRFTDITRNAVMSKMTLTESPSPENITINGSDARRYRLVGSKGDLKVAYLISTVETPAHFHQIYTWTEPSRLNENGPVLNQVADSFRAVSDTGVGNSSPSP